MSFAAFWIEDTFSAIASLSGFTVGSADEVMKRRSDGCCPVLRGLTASQLHLAGSSLARLPYAKWF